MAQVLLCTIDGLIMQRLVGADGLSLDSIAAFFESSIAANQVAANQVDESGM
jgi:hypothetical protein